MYSKLIVSSLESRATQGDKRAIAELVSRSKQGMKRARLAIERLLELKLPTETRDQLLGYKYSPETIQTVRETIRPVKHSCNHGNSLDMNCDTCRAIWQNGFEPLIAEERAEIAKFGYRTAQQIDNEKRGIKHE